MPLYTVTAVARKRRSGKSWQTRELILNAKTAPSTAVAIAELAKAGYEVQSVLSVVASKH